MCYPTRRECVPTLALRVVTEHFFWQSGKSPSIYEGIMWFKCTGCRKLRYTELNGSSPRVLKFSWHCHLIWPGVNLPWTSLHYAKSVVEVSGKQVASTFSHSWSERRLLDTKLDGLHSLGEFPPKLLLLVSENKPQKLRKCFHVRIALWRV